MEHLPEKVRPSIMSGKRGAGKKDMCLSLVRSNGIPTM